MSQQTSVDVEAIERAAEQIGRVMREAMSKEAAARRGFLRGLGLIDDE